MLAISFPCWTWPSYYVPEVLKLPSFLHYDDAIIRAQDSGLDIGLSHIDFPPKGCELPDIMTTPDWLHQFIKALTFLQEPFEKLLQEIRPDAIISDSFMHWTSDSAAKFGIPRLVFLWVRYSGYLPMCAFEELRLHKPYQSTADDQPFVIPNLPGNFTFLRSQVPTFELEKEDKKDDPFTKWLLKMEISDERSYGTIFNSFYELEPDYVDHWRNGLGRKGWQVGPLFLSNDENPEERSCRGKKSSDVAAQDPCLAWLNSKPASSVVYVCFGSKVNFTSAQQHETAIGLEASDQDFIWVVRQNKGDKEEWLPEGFEERVKPKGLLVRGWAPQLLILDHPAISAFVTHCGWNSTIEGICAGVPMVAWPVNAEQHYNEKLLVDVMKTGVSVGNKKWTLFASEGVSSETIATAVKDIMRGKGVEEMRKRAKGYKERARKAVQPGGSSFCCMTDFIEELSNYPKSNGKA